MITQINPNAGTQGQTNLTVTITGQLTHFVRGTTTATFGAGITVASLTVNSATSATAVLSIDPTAVIGARDVTLTTGAEVVTLVNGFAIATMNQPPVVSTGPNQTLAFPPPNTQGKIVVTNDEWQLSNTGFSATQAGSTQFARNVAQWFSGSPTKGNFLVYSSNFGLDPSQATSLASVMQGAGYTWTSYKSIPGFTFDLTSLAGFQGVFLACPEIPDNAVLIDYVNSGGNVYLEGGTAACTNGPDAKSEAADWNLFLNAFGLAFDPAYNGVTGDIPITNVVNSPIMSVGLFTGIERCQPG